MSRKNKNYRAWLHQNPNGTPKEAWDAGWASQQGKAYSLRIQELETRIAEMEAEIKRAFIAGYHTGHDHTVEGFFQWCDQGSSDVADDWIADDAEDKALEGE